MLLSAALSFNLRIILSSSFSVCSSSLVVCVCNHYRRTNQNCHSIMGMASHLSCLSHAFSSYRFSFSLIYLNWCHSMNYISSVSLTMMGLDSGPLVRSLFHFPLVNPLVVLVNFLLVSVAYALDILFRLESNHLVTFLCWSCLYQEESSPKLVHSS